jgi:WD40 repeat protein
MTYRAFEHFLSLEGHSGSVISVAITADKQTLVSGSWDKTIKIWHLPTGKLQQTLEGHRSSVNQVVISKDAQTLVSASNEIINIWHLPTRKLKKILDIEKIGCGQHVTLSPCDRYLVGGGIDGNIRIWDLATGELQKTWITCDRKSKIHSIARLVFTADGRTLIGCSSDKTIRVWEMSTHQLVRTLTGHTGVITSIALSSDEQILVSGSCDESVRIWDWKTGEQKQQLGGYPGQVPMDPIHPSYGTTPSRPTIRCVAISSDGKTIFSGDELSQIKIWDRVTGKIQQTLKQRYGNVLGLLLVDENTFVTGGEHNINLYSNKANDIARNP